MSPKEYFSAMLLTNPQKAKRILMAIELENWFMDLFDEEYEDVLNGTFITKQDAYIEKIVDKYLETAKVDVMATELSRHDREVIQKATDVASEVQSTTLTHLLDLKEDGAGVSEFIGLGLAFSAVLFSTDEVQRWLGKDRATLIAINESNWINNSEEYDEALGKYKTKVWHTALDEKVRLTHVEVESEEVPIDEPFHVGGSQLMFPTDTSLGASPSEIINCRCTVEYK